MNRQQLLINFIYYISGVLVGIMLVSCLFSCISNKSGCDAYSSTKHNYCIEGYVAYKGDTCKATAYVNEYKATKDSVYYTNSNGTKQTLISPYKIYENKSRK